MLFSPFSGCGCNLHKTKEIELYHKQFFSSVPKGHGNPGLSLRFQVAGDMKLVAGGTKRQGRRGLRHAPPPPRKFWNKKVQKCFFHHFPAEDAIYTRSKKSSCTTNSFSVSCPKVMVTHFNFSIKFFYSNLTFSFSSQLAPNGTLLVAKTS